MRKKHENIDYYDYKVISMPRSIFKESDVVIILDKMKNDGWILYDKSKDCYFLKREKHCSKEHFR